MATGYESRPRSRSPRGQADGSKQNVKDLLGNRPMVNKVKFASAEGVAVAQSFKAEQGDVMIVTYPKTGTTWMQQICHQLRTGGDTSFEEICEEGIVPWIEVAPDLGMDVNRSQTAPPRCFKTHQLLSALSHLEADGARYLCVVRDPKAALLSFFRFQYTKGHPAAKSGDVNVYLKSGHTIPGGTDGLSPAFGGHLWDYYLEFWRCRKLPNVKVIVYEHMLKDLNSQLFKIAELMGLPSPSEELRKEVIRLSSMDWMSAHPELFDEHTFPGRLAGTTRAGTFQPTSKVGLKVGAEVNTTLTQESLQIIDRMWKEIVLPVTGHASYADMVADF